MSDVRAFRFGAESFESTRSGVLADARKAEALGFDVFLTPDHLFDHLAPIATTMMVAEQAEGLRVGTYVLCNDFHRLRRTSTRRPLARIRRLRGKTEG